jgi:hypothetical protein
VERDITECREWLFAVEASSDSNNTERLDFDACQMANGANGWRLLAQMLVIAGRV